MHKVVGAALAVMLLAVAPGAADDAGTTGSHDDVVLAILDTGVRASHQEFAPGQILAMQDFTGKGNANDGNGHGTATATIAAGATVGSAPGTKLLIGKVLNDAGSSTSSSVANGFRWAMDQGADIISMSLGSYIPTGPLGAGNAMFQEARERGILVLVAAGNGAGNLCGPTTSWLHAYGNSQHAVVVTSLHESGGQNTLFTCANPDADIAGHGYTVRHASHTGDARYGSGSGTSYATPNVAGYAAALMQAARDNGVDDSDGRIEQLLLDCATDEGWPYAWQGHGFFDAEAQGLALPHAADGASTCEWTGVAGAKKDVAHAYQQNVVDRIQDLGSGAVTFAVTPVPVTTGPAELGPSSPGGAAELELYRVNLAAGQSVTLTAHYAGGTPGNDFDVAMYQPGAADDGVLAASERLKILGNQFGQDEAGTFTAVGGGDYLVALYGWSIAAPQPVTGTVVALDRVGEYTVLAQSAA